MKLITSLLICLLAALPCAAQEASTLRFRPDGTFKILQVTDTHYKTGKSASRAAVENITSALDAEQPDLVIFTGDQVYADGVAEALRALTAPIVERGVPFAFVFGNHDHQFDMTLPDSYDLMRSFPGCLAPDRGSIPSPDYTLEIRSAADSSRVASVLYLLDSHQGSKIKNTGKYDWLKTSQIVWYKANSTKYTELNGGKPIPSLMFFHIPLPEMEYAWSQTDSYIAGTHGEDICSPKMNSGMFTAIKEQGDVFGVFFGHDHDNDYATTYWNILLAYGRYSGGKTVYTHLGKPGVRVITLREGERALSTAVRLTDGTILDPVDYPASFDAKRKKKKK